MARKPNHAWQKRQREQEKLERREAKRERKRLAKESGDSTPETDLPAGGAEVPGELEERG